MLRQVIGRIHSLLNALASVAHEPGILRQHEGVHICSVVFAGTGTPVAALSSGVMQATLGNSDNTIGISFVLPPNYDSNKYASTDALPGDQLKVRVHAIATTTTTNTLEIDDIQYWREGGTAVVDPTLSSTQDDSQTVSATAFDIYEFDLSGLGLTAGDAVSITVGCTIAGNDIIVRGIEVWYRGYLLPASNLVR